MRIHMLENVDKCLQFLKKKEVNTVNKILLSSCVADENFYMRQVQGDLYTQAM